MWVLGIGVIFWGLGCFGFVFEKDDRKSLEDFPRDSWVQTVARSTALITHRKIFQFVQQQPILMPFISFGDYQESIEEGLCNDEPFRNDPIVDGPAGTGFLITDQILLTAGHIIINQDSCDRQAVVFDFHSIAKRNFWMPIPEENFYTCKEVILARRQSHESGEWMDFSVIRLDRPVLDRVPLKLNPQKMTNSPKKVWMVGHPMGLPTKVTENGMTFGDLEKNFFRSTLDTYRGNSGAPVVNLETGLIDGILAEGEITDITQRSNSTGDGCWYSKRYCHIPGPHCDEILSNGAVAMRIDSVLNQLREVAGLRGRF